MRGGGTTANHNGALDKIPQWPKRAGIPHMDGASGLPRTCKGLFTHITQALNIDGTDLEERKATHAIIPSLVVDLRALSECAQDTAMGT